MKAPRQDAKALGNSQHRPGRKKRIQGGLKDFRKFGVCRLCVFVHFCFCLFAEAVATTALPFGLPFLILQKLRRCRSHDEPRSLQKFCKPSPSGGGFFWPKIGLGCLINLHKYGSKLFIFLIFLAFLLLLKGLREIL